MSDKSNQKYNKITLALVLLGVAFIWIKGMPQRAEERALRKLEKRNELRGEKFANYVFSDVNTYVLQNKPNQSEINSVASSRDLKSQEQRIQNLAQDSAKYADAIRRDAPVVISYLDNTRVYEYMGAKTGKRTLDETARETLKKYGRTGMSFKAALQYVQQESKMATSPEYIKDKKPVYVTNDGENISMGYGRIQVGDTGEAFTMKVNINHLKDVSKELAFNRAVKAQIIKNTKMRKR